MDELMYVSELPIGTQPNVIKILFLLTKYIVDRSYKNDCYQTRLTCIFCNI